MIDHQRSEPQISEAIVDHGDTEHGEEEEDRGVSVRQSSHVDDIGHPPQNHVDAPQCRRSDDEGRMRKGSRRSGSLVG